MEAKNFQLAPSFFDRKKFGTEVLVFPDRIRLTVDAIRKGTGAMFLGGWLSFTGEMGKGGWNRTGLKDVLPVQCLDYEDLVESTEGFIPKVGAKSKKKVGGASSSRHFLLFWDTTRRSREKDPTCCSPSNKRVILFLFTGSSEKERYLLTCPTRLLTEGAISYSGSSTRIFGWSV